MNDTGAPRPFQPAPTKVKPKILLELRPCFEGFAGIPQETRLLFSALANIPNIQLGGLLNTYNSTKRPNARNLKASHEKRVYEHAKTIIELEMANANATRERGVLATLLRKMRKKHYGFILEILIRSGISQELTAFSAEDFGDFLWSRLFAKTLDSTDRERVLRNQFFHTSLGWRTANIMCRHPRLTPKLDTRGWDVFVSQVPFPGSVHPSTQHLVRYHDAIPMFLAHTIPEPKPHASSHYHALKCNVRNGAHFACTSEPVREDLLRLFPAVEKNINVIPDIVSPQFRPEPHRPRVLAEILKHRVSPASQAPKADGSKQTSAAHELLPKVEQFVLAVSTLEPRKNYALLLNAWEQARRRLEKPPKLVIVAHPGWGYDAELATIAGWVKARELFHLWMVPIEELRILYSMAHIVICPSRAEGFDLSGVESMLCGTPVVASDIPVHRWVYGDAAVYFDPYSTNALADRLVELCRISKNEGNLADMRDRGERRGKLYTSSAIAPKWEALFHQLSGRDTGTGPIASSHIGRQRPALSGAEPA